MRDGGERRHSDREFRKRAPRPAWCWDRMWDRRAGHRCATGPDRCVARTSDAGSGLRAGISATRTDTPSQCCPWSGPPGRPAGDVVIHIPSPASMVIRGRASYNWARGFVRSTQQTFSFSDTLIRQKSLRRLARVSSIGVDERFQVGRIWARTQPGCREQRSYIGLLQRPAHRRIRRRSPRIPLRAICHMRRARGVTGPGACSLSC